jgi:hypothetical protein
MQRGWGRRSVSNPSTTKQKGVGSEDFKEFGMEEVRPRREREGMKLELGEWVFNERRILKTYEKHGARMIGEIRVLRWQLLRIHNVSKLHSV